MEIATASINGSRGSFCRSYNTMESGLLGEHPNTAGRR